MSLLRRIFNLIRSPTRYVGRDLQGNRFYEHPGISDDLRTKRTVQYRNPEDVWNYIGGGKRLPVQWSMWLSHTRRHPPTVEELHQDLERQQRVLANAAVLEARDQAEREARLRIEQSVKEETANRVQIERPLVYSESSHSTSTHEMAKPSSPTEALPQPSDETASWSPKTLRRG
ncbi:hypothetical protein P691DRAFT_764717 [Macrolepiota fuliginosa MF-IS2]|uniref:NADH dehydrogenase [ubiquinone] 1 alpha subcomplex subunit n=1 Tax=Macrolepiota fuliginosa MF-IS2 TaxID=1400762 RepID=A0A9P5X294_9AGAR|nr:hypothetical protein P691DRAFT_764717 [Macrolepiota fuliginosa MF-IS2]